LSYAPAGEEKGPDPLFFSGTLHTHYVPLRSKPCAIKPFRNRSGSISYRVTGSIRGKQRKKVFLNLEDAQSMQTIWETERIQGAAAARPKISHLTQAQIKQAEAAFELLNDSGSTVLDAVRHFLRNPPFVAPKKTFGEAFDAFVAAREAHLSEAQLDNYRIRGASFRDSVGAKTLLTEITDAEVCAWLEEKDVGKKTWNNYRGDLMAMFEWFTAPARKWINENPVAAVERFGKRSLARAHRQRLEVQQCRELMAFLEEFYPEWCTFFAVALFAGVRPDMRNGEMFELARCVGRDGIGQYYHGGFFHLSEEIVKDGASRQTTVHENLARWLDKYPPTKESLCPADYDAYGIIREKFKIPHDGLRHTAVSAYVAKYGSFALAADEFGNSEKIIREHYHRRMPKEDAEAFYQIFPEAGQRR